MNKDIRALNTVFRITVFLTFAVSSLAATMFIYCNVRIGTVEKSAQDEMIRQMFDRLLLCYKLYDWLLIGVVLCTVMSLFTSYRTSKAGFVMRTGLLATLTAYVIKGRAVPAAMVKVMNALDKMGIRDFSISDEALEEALRNNGAAEAEISECIKAVNSDNLMALLIAYGMAMMILLFLSITSLHSLLKKDASDGEAEEQYAYFGDGEG